MNMPLRKFFLACLILVLASCNTSTGDGSIKISQSQTAFFQASRTSTVTHSNTPTSTVSPSRTVTLTNTASPTPTPFFPLVSDTITIANAKNLTLLATWGRGTNIDSRWLYDNRLLAIQTKAGIYVVDSSDLSFRKEWFGAKSLAVSHDRTVMAIGYGTGAVTIWNAKTNQQTDIRQQFTGSIEETSFPDALALSDDGSILVIAGTDGQTGLWDTQAGTIINIRTMVKRGIFSITGIALSPDEKKIVTYSGNYTTDIYDLESGSKTPLPGFAGYFSNYPFSQDGSRLVTVQDYDAVIWDTKTGSLLSHRLLGKSDETKVIFSDDGQYLIVDDFKRIIRVSDGREMPLDTVPNPFPKPIPDLSTFAATDFFPGPITGTGIDAEGALFAWGTDAMENATPLWWDVKGQVIAAPDWSRCKQLDTSFNFGTRSVSPDCSLEIVSKSHLFYMYQTIDGTLLHNLNAHTLPITSMTFSNDGKYFASGASVQGSGEAVLWRTEPTAGVWKLLYQGDGRASVTISPDDSLLAVSFLGIHIYDIEKRQEVKKFASFGSVQSISPDNQIVVVQYYSPWDSFIGLHAWRTGEYYPLYGDWGLSPLTDLLSPRFEKTVRGVQVTFSGFTFDGKGLLVGLSDGTVRFFGIRSG
jgi:WD40 repeat protein